MSKHKKFLELWAKNLSYVFERTLEIPDNLDDYVDESVKIVEKIILNTIKGERDGKKTKQKKGR